MKKKIDIEGMTCMHCVAHVEKALKGLEGVSKVSVSLEDKSAVVKMKDETPDNVLAEAIKEAGYDAVNIEIKKSLF